MKYIVALFICCLAISEISCKKDNKAPIDQLPPATQQGKKTFGCLVNGEAWMPKGAFPFGAINPYVSYDPTYENGALTISAMRVLNDGRFEIIIGGKNVNKAGTYVLGTAGTDAAQGAMVNDNKTGCRYSGIENGTLCQGTLEVTKLSVSEGIIAGTFSFIISKPGCKTLSLTEGRFDLKM